jgi:hypothetical protein
MRTGASGTYFTLGGYESASRIIAMLVVKSLIQGLKLHVYLSDYISDAGCLRSNEKGGIAT